MCFGTSVLLVYLIKMTIKGYQMAPKESNNVHMNFQSYGTDDLIKIWSVNETTGYAQLGFLLFFE